MLLYFEWFTADTIPVWFHQALAVSQQVICYLGAWALIFIGMNPLYVNVGVNFAYTAYTFTFASYLEGTNEYLGHIGGFTDSVANSFNGFMWGYVLHDTVIAPSTYLYSYYTPGTCLYGQCQTFCSPAFYYNGATVCLSTNLHQNQNSAGASCMGCSNGCLGTTCLDCACTNTGCTVSGGSAVCACPSGSTLVGSECTCSSGGLLVGGNCITCYEECATCTTSSLCSSCIASHAGPDASLGCDCDAGYYGTRPLILANSCSACDVECDTCSQANKCLTCVAANASPDTAQGCNCNSGFYGTRPLIFANSCLACYSECATCSQTDICSTCIAVNASPDAVQGCNCDARYYGSKPLDLSGSCSACYVECATCSEALVCLTCVSENAYIQATQGCLCTTGNYGTAPLSSLNSCSPCYQECTSCNQASICLTCVSSNASPNSIEGCVCTPGYYGIGPLITVDACLVCYEECETCTEYNQCLTCISPLAVPSNAHGCICGAGSYGSSPLVSSNSCLACYLECSTCIQSGLCSQCLSDNASPSSTVGCTCNAGFYGDNPLISKNSCMKCYLECLTCSQPGLCITCISANASPGSEKGCACNLGFYGNAPLILSNSCRECYLECASCTQESLCSACISINASPIGTAGCACDLGYYGNSPLTERDSCTPCSTECIEYNSTTGNCMACKACPPHCDTCDSITCLTCTSNAYLIGLHCTCKPGYFGPNTCEPSFLYAVLTRTNSNSLNLVFSSQLVDDLNSSDITITACISLTFVLEKWSPVRYFIILDIQVPVPANCTLDLTFLNPADILSTENAILSNRSLNIQLLEGSSEEVAVASIIADATTTSGKITTSTTAAALLLSLLTRNPATFWSFINTVQMLCFIEISNIPQPPRFSGYLAGLRKYNMFPNIFAYFVPESGGQVPFKKAYDFGYTTNLLLLNSGNYLSAFILMIALFIITLISSKFTHVKPFSIKFIKKGIENSLKNYKYGAFVRFWITCYLDVFAAALIAMITSNQFTVYLSINLFLAIVITVSCI